MNAAQYTKSGATLEQLITSIDLSEPGTWSSGRSDEDSQLVAQNRTEAAAAPEEAAAGEDVLEQQRAVGS